MGGNGEVVVKILQIEDAEEISKEIQADGVIVLAFDMSYPGDMQSVSYGKDKSKRDIMGRLMDNIFDAVAREDIKP